MFIHSDFELKSEPPLEEMEEEYRDLYDKWCWETGDDEDKKKLDKLWVLLKSRRVHESLIDEVIAHATEQIKQEMDKELLEMLHREAAK